MADSDQVAEDHPQIRKDLHRTFPNVSYFNMDSPGYIALQIVLKMYTIYDKNACGYVQGMNFPAGMMVYHSCPSIAFCIFVKLLETHDIKSNYTPGLPGLLEKC